MTAFQNETNKQAAKRYFKTAKQDLEALEVNTKLGVIHYMFHAVEWCQQNPKKFWPNLLAGLGAIAFVCVALI
jgi:hypothetical protein